MPLLSAKPHAETPKLDPRLIAERIESFLASRGLHASDDTHDVASVPFDVSKTATTATSIVQPSDGAEKTATDTIEKLEPVEFVAEEDVRRALQSSQQIVINERTIVTPAANDLAAEHEVFVDLSVGRTR